MKENIMTVLKGIAIGIMLIILVTAIFIARGYMLNAKLYENYTIQQYQAL